MWAGTPSSGKSAPVQDWGKWGGNQHPQLHRPVPQEGLRRNTEAHQDSRAGRGGVSLRAAEEARRALGSPGKCWLLIRKGPGVPGDGAG